MKEILLITLFLTSFILLSVLCTYLFDKYSIRKKYYSIVAINKYIYYLTKFILSIIFVILGITSFIINEIYLYIIFIIYCYLYLSLYKRHTIKDWEKVKNIYLKKIYIDKNTKKKKKLILFIIVILIIILSIIFYNIISYKISLINKWNKIESSYEIINEMFLEYYNEYCDIECNENSSILLYFSNIESKITLSEKEKNAIYKIENY